MPAGTSKKSKTPDAVPSVGDPDRKRVLNVLAQRRYRQKRRAKIAELEAKIKSVDVPVLQSSSSESPEGGIRLDEGITPAPDLLLNPTAEINVEEMARGADLANMNIDFAPLDFGESDLGFLADLDFSKLDLPNESSSSEPAIPNSTLNPTYPTTQAIFDFPLTLDASSFQIPFLPALRAFSIIASTLSITEHIYNPTYLHVLPPTPHPSLPPNLHPTPAQLTIPHHPMLDTLPWPGTREKLICMFALPSFCRPPVAQGDEGSFIVKMMLDLDDYTEGIRNHGRRAGEWEGNELVEEAWEVGQVFFEGWWWCLDQGVVERSNRRRRERGLERLRVRSS